MSSPFEQLFDISPFPAVISRLSDNAVIAINRRNAEMFGISHADAVGLKTTDYYADISHRERLRAPLEATGKADNVILHLRKPNGDTFWARASARLITWDNEQAVLTVIEDISDQLAARHTLEASEQRLAAQSRALTSLTESDPSETFENRLRVILQVAAKTLHVDRVSLWQFDDTRSAIICAGLFRWNDAVYEYGARLERNAAPAYFDAIERERVIAANDARNDPRTREFRTAYLEPHNIFAMLDVPLRRGSDVIGVLCAEHVASTRTWTADEQNFAVSTANLIALAIADDRRRDALRQVAASDARAHMILDTAHDAFIGMDETGNIVNWNAQAEQTFGWTREEAMGRNLADTIIPPAFREAHNKGMARFLATGEAPVVNRRLELRALHREGREFPIEITITSPMKRGDGYFFGAFLRDITERIERDETLRKAKEAAEAATRAKSEFLANMSHELRTPLNGVIGYSQLLQRDRDLTAQQRDAIDAISKCGTHLLDLINDVLDLSKIEAGRVDVEQSATDLPQLVTDLGYVLGEAARRKNLALNMSIEPGLPARVVLDGRHLRQVLLNLLGNAIKFTQKGEVALNITAHGDDALLFSVTDTGPGIEPEELARIFEAFTQTESGAAAGGTGLGLTISRHLLEIMGAELHVDSTLGEGSRFFFALPLVAAEGEDAVAVPDASKPPLHAKLAPGQQVTALVVDDSTVSRRILASLLESAGLQVITATGGIEGITLARDHHPDVIFMDVKMADLDGFTATRKLAAEDGTKRIPVIAVTASALGDTKKAAREAGCAAYLPKPVRAEALFAALHAHLGLRFVWEDSEEASASAASPLRREEPQPRHAPLASRLREAAEIGAVTDLQALADSLALGDDADVALGKRINTLAANFDFDGVRELAGSLAALDRRDAS
ncbi:MAG TPA: PAS domain S-box protein [Vicinamibacterales bacterium]